MANKNLFSSSSNVVATNLTQNHAGGVAYSQDAKSALAQMAMTGTFGQTYYVSEKDQLKEVLALANQVEPKFLAQLAVYSKEKGMMKDMPALLLAVLAGKDSVLFSKVFSRIVNNPKMARNFVQIIRSGVTGRKSLGTRPKKLLQNYLNSMTDDQLFRADVGNDPSLQDIIKLVHPKPQTESRAALYSYLLDSNKDYDKKALPDVVKHFEDFKKEMGNEIPNVPFQMLTALKLTDLHWKNIAKNATWTQIRMNLNTFSRHNVLKEEEMVELIANKLQDKEQIKRSNVFPYQLYSAFLAVQDVPRKISNALQAAADHSLMNIPEFEGKKVYVMVDTSGSMSGAVTGNRGSVTSKMRCIDVAGLFASAVLRKNPNAEVIPFDTRVHTSHDINSLDSIMTNATKLAKFGGGGTDCGVALKSLNDRKISGEDALIIYVSDNESNMGNRSYYSTNMQDQWNAFKKRNPKSHLACIDITPNTAVQAVSDASVLNVGGFSDTVFEVISNFIKSDGNKDYWTKMIENAVTLD